MSDHDDGLDGRTESQLRVWFETAKAPPAPPTLRAFAAQIGHGERPRVTQVTRPAIGWRSMAGNPLAATLFAIALVAGGILIVVGQRGSAAPSNSPPIGPTASFSPSLRASSPAISLAPSESPTVSKPRPTTAIDDGGGFGTAGLWATRGGSLFLSVDEGASWIHRAMEPGVALDIASGNVLSSVFVLDADHVWTAQPGPGSTVPYGGQGPEFDHLHAVVSRTTNGGTTWQTVSIPGDWGGTQPVLSFADAQHGFLLLSGLRGGPEGVVFASDDGGATWKQVGAADGVGSVFAASDATTLWAGNQGDAGPVARPILDVSRDGGRTWKDARLPGMVGDIFVNDTLVAPPVFDGDDGAVAVLAGSMDNPPDARFYRTTDGGRTWLLAARRDAALGGASLAVIDPTHFIVIDPSGLQTTSDGGTTWQRSSSSGLGSATHVHFWDRLSGGAIVQTRNEDAPGAGAFRTADGGETWTSIPVPEPDAPALTVDHPTLTITPVTGLVDGQSVEVRLSECSSAVAATDLGCGLDLASQSFLLTDDNRAGSSSFVVRADAPDQAPSRTTSRCTNGCVVVATIGAGYPFRTAPISFLRP
jgi:hypothetical protein